MCFNGPIAIIWVAHHKIWKTHITTAPKAFPKHIADELSSSHPLDHFDISWQSNLVQALEKLVLEPSSLKFGVHFLGFLTKKWHWKQKWQPSRDALIPKETEFVSIWIKERNKVFRVTEENENYWVCDCLFACLVSVHLYCSCYRSIELCLLHYHNNGDSWIMWL